MRPRYLFITILTVFIFIAAFVLRTAGSLPRGLAPPTTPVTDQVAMSEQVEDHVEAAPFVAATHDPVLIQPASQKDGPALLESHCNRCHTLQSLTQIKKSRSEWENALAKMEALGVHLDENEKIILLDYLSLANQP
jgi:cytochrome c5